MLSRNHLLCTRKHSGKSRTGNGLLGLPVVVPSEFDRVKVGNYGGNGGIRIQSPYMMLTYRNLKLWVTAQWKHSQQYSFCEFQYSCFHFKKETFVEKRHGIRVCIVRQLSVRSFTKISKRDFKLFSKNFKGKIAIWEKLCLSLRNCHILRRFQSII